uniref:Polysaccharide biosynthesis domain containing 1 n=1 Tax=Ornithorhynchus anatinus TaxID=9258 RepID=A0A6I8PJG0_ORNAN
MAAGQGGGGGLEALGPGGLMSAAQALSLPAEAYGNDPNIEMVWAMKAVQHAEVYYNLISSVDCQFLKLTKVDDRIYSEFRECFKDLKVDVLDPEELKSEPAKEINTPLAEPRRCQKAGDPGPFSALPPAVSFSSLLSSSVRGREVEAVLSEVRRGRGGLQLRHLTAAGLHAGLQ